MNVDRRWEGSFSFRDVCIHQQVASVGTCIDNVFPQAAAVTAQPGCQVHLPGPNVRVPIFKLVNTAGHRVKNAVRHLFAHCLRTADRGFIVVRTMKHQYGHAGQCRMDLRLLTRFALHERRPKLDSERGHSLESSARRQLKGYLTTCIFTDQENSVRDVEPARTTDEADRFLHVLGRTVVHGKPAEPGTLKRFEELRHMGPLVAVTPVNDYRRRAWCALWSIGVKSQTVAVSYIIHSARSDVAFGKLC